MPCYDPPPPWEGRRIKSAERAVALLCDEVGGRLLDGRTVPREQIEWYIGHREIDLEIHTEAGRSYTVSAGFAWVKKEVEITDSIERAKAALKELRG